LGNSFEKVFIGNAGSAGGAGLDIDNVFSTFVYDGAQTTLVVNNGIDLATEDGITWVKCRNASEDHFLFSSLQNSDGQTLFLKPNETNAANGTNGISQTSTGFSLGGGEGLTNQINKQYVSWTFRKAPKFFDIVGPFTGNGLDDRVLSHNLGSTPGMVIFKRTSSGTSAQGTWFTHHRSSGFSGGLSLNGTESAGYTIGSPITAASDTNVTINNPANNGNVNADGATYMAYLFAHNDSGDGEFGPDGDQDIIKCGSYTGNGSSTGPVIDLGFEPQWVMVKNSSAAGGWQIMDSMRGIVTGGGDGRLQAQANAAESTPSFIDLTSTGFQVTSTGSNMNTNNATYIFMAIRRGPLAVPDDATKVFDIQLQSNADTYSVGFPTDLILLNKRGGSSANTYVGSRLTGDTKKLSTSTNAAEATYSSYWAFDLQNSFDQGASTSSAWVGWHWKRAPGYFDAVAYTGTGSNRTVSHNLTVPPEMMWVKGRTLASDWRVYHKSTGNTKQLRLNESAAASSEPYWNNTTPTSSVFSLNSNARVNGSGETYIAYLFATAPGVSKVGIFNHSNGTASNVDCGFSNGARFVLVKRSDGTGNWFVWDSVRGIVAGNDKRLALNTTGAENTGNDDIDPLNAGFTWVATWSTGYYIFYAIA